MLSVLEQLSRFGEPVLELGDDALMLGPHLIGRSLSEDRTDQRRDHALGGFENARQHVASEVRATPLPRTPQHGRDRVHETGAVVRDRQGHTGQPPGLERAQEREPPGAALGGDHIEAQDLTEAVFVDADRLDDRDRHRAGLSDLLGVGVEPHVDVGGAIEGSVAERLDHGIELLGELGDLLG